MTDRRGVMTDRRGDMTDRWGMGQTGGGMSDRRGDMTHRRGICQIDGDMTQVIELSERGLAQCTLIQYFCDRPHYAEHFYYQFAGVEVSSKTSAYV